MRDLEQEQRQIREALGQAARRHPGAQREAARQARVGRRFGETAQKFVKDVRASGASEAMAAAEAALAEFAPTRGHEKAKEAADILDKFIKRCDGIGQHGACKGLSVSAHPVQRAGQHDCPTAGQMMGIGHGRQRHDRRLRHGRPLRRTARNVRRRDGEYGDAHGGEADRRAGPRGQPHGENPDEAEAGDMFAPGAAGGASEGAVPVRYRRQVGQYFQRIAEETEESGN